MLTAPFTYFGGKRLALVSMMLSFDAAQYMGGAHGEIGDWELFFRKLLECA